jgi:predicted transcriptional regulator
MANRINEIETVMFQAFAHPMRRTIIKILIAKPEGVSYTEILLELGLSTGKLNYHLEQLEGLIEKNQQRLYTLTPLGKKAANQLRLLEQEVTKEDEKYLSIANKAQKTSLEPTVKSLLIIGIAASTVILLMVLAIFYMAVTENGTPSIVYFLLPALIAIQAAIILTLVRALYKTPQWLRKFERRFLEST